MLHTMCIMVIFQADPKETHVIVVKRVFRYLKGTMDFGLWYPRGNNFIILAYSDVDWVSCMDDRKSTSGGAFYLNDKLVAWHNKKQDSIYLSTVEEEYMAIVSCCTQVLWMKKKLKDLGILWTEPIFMWEYKCN